MNGLKMTENEVYTEWGKYLLNGVIKNTMEGRMNGEKTPMYYMTLEAVGGIGISLKLQYNKMIGLATNIVLLGAGDDYQTAEITNNLTMVIEQLTDSLFRDYPEFATNLCVELSGLPMTNNEQVELTNYLAENNCLSYC